jgi:hypothetical protein
MCMLHYFPVQGPCLGPNSINFNNYGNFSIQKFYMLIGLLNSILCATYLKNFTNEIIEHGMLLNKVKEIQEWRGSGKPVLQQGCLPRASVLLFLFWAPIINGSWEPTLFWACWWSWKSHWNPVLHIVPENPLHGQSMRSPLHLITLEPLFNNNYLIMYVIIL